MTRREIELIIRKNLNVLTRQQVKVFKGQLNAGDLGGAYKGLAKVLKRNNIMLS